MLDGELLLLQGDAEAPAALLENGVRLARSCAAPTSSMACWVLAERARL
ncbi:hypothetical protein P3W53_05485 [Pseudomonas denitrificans (nom. rej.)]|nr:hypothetical protein [Pseudomonas denitrificans (nom. rej.)]